MKQYEFNENEVYYAIYSHWQDFAKSLNCTKMVIGISGGIDSTCCAALAKKIFGEENVYGVSMPCDGQKDIDDVNKVFKHLGIRRIDIDIGDAFYSVLNGVENNGIVVSSDTKTNLPPRLRMGILYAVAQSIGAIVINTCNRSESDVGYDTLFGDDCGSYAPIQELTKTEVRKLAKYICVPNDLVMKKSIDGLQDKSDEERFGFTYDKLDEYIRTGVCDQDTIANIKQKYDRNKFKLEMVRIKGPKFNYPDYVRG